MSREQASALIMGVFGRNPKRVYNYKQISKLLFITDKQRKSLINNTLDELVNKKQLEQVEPGRYRLLSRAGYKTGSLDMTQHGYAFLISENSDDDVFIARNNLKTALDGDLVKVFGVTAKVPVRLVIHPEAKRLSSSSSSSRHRHRHYHQPRCLGHSKAPRPAGDSPSCEEVIIIIH